MRLIRSSILVALVVLPFFAASADAQIRRRPRVRDVGPSRFTLVGDLLAAQPKGELASQIDEGYGANVAGLFRLDREGIFSIRADLGGMQYGSETLYAPYLPITGRVSLDIETTNMVGWGSIGPQITVPVGPIQPYVHAAIGVASFVTSTSLRGSDSEYDYASSDNASDATTAYILGGGLYVPFGQSRSWKLHGGGRYFRGGEATYLREGDIRDNPDGSITLSPRTSKTDMVTWQLGVSYTFPRERHRGRGW
ncbi:MAG: hypothetical protein WKF55_08355 [Gemmatimonadaceae bacterium]